MRYCSSLSSFVLFLPLRDKEGNRQRSRAHHCHAGACCARLGSRRPSDWQLGAQGLVRTCCFNPVHHVELAMSMGSTCRRSSRCGQAHQGANCCRIFQPFCGCQWDGCATHWARPKIVAASASLTS
jgi:hypothetical protein